MDVLSWLLIRFRVVIIDPRFITYNEQKVVILNCFLHNAYWADSLDHFLHSAYWAESLEHLELFLVQCILSRKFGRFWIVSCGAYWAESLEDLEWFLVVHTEQKSASAWTVSCTVHTWIRRSRCSLLRRANFAAIHFIFSSSDEVHCHISYVQTWTSQIVIESLDSKHSHQMPPLAYSGFPPHNQDVRWNKVLFCTLQANAYVACTILD